MNHTKKEKNKLERLRGIFFQIGLLVAGGLTLVAFEWTSPKYIATLDGEVVEEIEWDYNYVEPFEIEKEEIKEEKVEKPKVNLEKFDIVKDDHKEKENEDKKEEKKVIVPDLKKFKVVEPEDPDENKKFTVVEKMPEFVGSLNMYLMENIKYPEDAKRIGAQGKVYVSFLVNKKGEIEDVEIIRGVNKWLDAEALRVVKNMPAWSPGKQRGKPVNVVYNLPINFKLK